MSTFLISDGFGGDQYEFLTGGLDSAAISGFFITGGLGGSISEYLLDGLAPSGALTQSVTVCTTTSWTGYSLQENQTPAVSVGDSFYADLYTTPGHYAVTVAGDGTVTVDALGDTTRQRFNADIFSVALGAFYGSFTVYINNHGPQINVQPSDVAVLTNNAMSAINFTPTDPLAVNYVIDLDNDPITGAQISGGLPVGVTFAGNILSGTPTSAVSNNVTFRFTDTVGAYVDCTINYLSDVGAIVPNIVGRTAAEAAADLASVGLSVALTSTSAYSPTVPAGNIISQGTAAGSRVFSGSQVNTIVSLGAGPATTMPDLVGLIDSVALSDLAVLGLNVGTITYTYTDSYISGTVLTQSVAAGTTVVYGSSVNLTVARPVFTSRPYLSSFGLSVDVGFPR